MRAGTVSGTWPTLSDPQKVGLEPESDDTGTPLGPGPARCVAGTSFIHSVICSAPTGQGQPGSEPVLDT